MESTETEVLIFRSEEWGLEFSAPILLRQQLRQRHDTVRDIKAEVLAVEKVLVKKVLTPSFGEPFALQKVRKTSFMKILQGKVYCKAAESINSTKFCHRSAGSARLSESSLNIALLFKCKLYISIYTTLQYLNASIK